MLRLSIVSNELPPYRIPFFQTLHRMQGILLQVLFCTRREPNRQWELPALDFGHVFLQERIITVRGRYIHNNPGVVPALHAFAPDVIVTGGFNPTHLYAFAYATARRIPHVVMTDGTDVSERGLSKVHRIVRRIVYARSSAYVAASNGGLRLFQNYGLPAEACFKSCLCIDNDAFKPAAPGQPKLFDLLFCGRIEAVKNPLFALEVAFATAKRLQRKVSILFIGSGEQELLLKATAKRYTQWLEPVFQEFTAHHQLPALYRSARLFLFPTRWDPWGVVTNEACATGLPALVSPEAGVAGELVVDGHNGFVCKHDVGLWADRAAMLLSEPDEWQRFSQNSQAMVKHYTYANAATGITAACRYALSKVPSARAKITERYHEK